MGSDGPQVEFRICSDGKGRDSRLTAGMVQPLCKGSIVTHWLLSDWWKASICTPLVRRQHQASSRNDCDCDEYCDVEGVLYGDGKVRTRIASRIVMKMMRQHGDGSRDDCYQGSVLTITRMFLMMLIAMAVATAELLSLAAGKLQFPHSLHTRRHSLCQAGMPYRSNG